VSTAAATATSASSSSFSPGTAYKGREHKHSTEIGA
jgi:hypothetical protein